MNRKRQDSRRETTQAGLIEAAERLFAEQGVEAVSTRQIAAAAGSLNTNVVAYHFGSKDALIEAVFHRRLPDIDRRRGELLAELAAGGGEPTIAQLMRVFAMPLFEQTNAEGRHSYVQFLSGLERSGMSASRGLVMKDYPESQRVTAALVSRLPPATGSDGYLRIRMVVSMLTTLLQEIDRTPGLSPEKARAMFDNAITMAAAAFGAPAAEGTPA